MANELNKLVDERVALETRLQNETGDTSRYESEYTNLQRKLAALLRDTHEERERITVMLELMRILENRLVYLHNFQVDPTSDNRLFAQLVTRFIDQISGTTVLTKLEEAPLTEIAQQTKGTYTAARTGPVSLVELFRGKIETGLKREAVDEAPPMYIQRYEWFFAAALLLFMLEMTLGARNPAPSRHHVPSDARASAASRKA